MRGMLASVPRPARWPNKGERVNSDNKGHAHQLQRDAQVIDASRFGSVFPSQAWGLELRLARKDFLIRFREDAFLLEKSQITNIMVVFAHLRTPNRTAGLEQSAYHPLGVDVGGTCKIRGRYAILHR